MKEPTKTFLDGAGRPCDPIIGELAAELCSKAYNQDKEKVFSKSRRLEHTVPRAMAIWATNEIGNFTNTKLQEMFNLGCHSTAIRAIEAAEAYRSSSENFRKVSDSIKQTIMTHYSSRDEQPFSHNERLLDGKTED